MRKSPNSILSRTGAAIFGGYLLANAVSFVVASALPLHQIDAALWAMQLSYFFYAAAAVWAFSAKNAGTAWLGLLGGSAFSLLIWVGAKVL